MNFSINHQRLQKKKEKEKRKRIGFIIYAEKDIHASMMPKLKKHW